MVTTLIPDDVDEIAGGFWVPKSEMNIPLWQRQLQRLDHDLFLPPSCARYIPTGGCAIDGGAFDGDHTIAYSNKAGPNGLIFAFEPGPLAFKCLEHNVGLFTHDNTIVAPFALGSGNDCANHVEIPGGDLGSAYLDDNGSGVKVVALDSIIKPGFPNHRKVDFIKLDIEGWELEALKGATRILTEDRPILVLEINVAALQRMKTDFNAIKFLLQSLGYLSRQIDGQQHDPMLWDEICWPREMGENPVAQN